MPGNANLTPTDNLISSDGLTGQGDKTTLKQGVKQKTPKVKAEKTEMPVKPSAKVKAPSKKVQKPVKSSAKVQKPVKASETVVKSTKSNLTKAKARLTEVQKDLKSVYEQYFENKEGFTHDFNGIITNLHEYCQALIINELVTGDSFTEESVQAVYDLFRKADLFSGLKNMREITDRLKQRLQKQPTAFTMLVAVDKYKKQGLSSSFIDSIYEIYLLLTSSKIKNIKKKGDLLIGLINMAKAQGVL